MIKKALEEITKISDDEMDNTENYLDALNYLDNLYKLVTSLQSIIDINEYSFLPSFKGKYIVERLGIPSTDKENQLKYFKLKSEQFFNRNIVKMLMLNQDKFDSMEIEDDILTIVLF